MASPSSGAGAASGAGASDPDDTPRVCGLCGQEHPPVPRAFPGFPFGPFGRGTSKMRIRFSGEKEWWHEACAKERGLIVNSTDARKRIGKLFTRFEGTAKLPEAAGKNTPYGQTRYFRIADLDAVRDASVVQKAAEQGQRLEDPGERLKDIQKRLRAATKVRKEAQAAADAAQATLLAAQQRHDELKAAAAAAKAAAPKAPRKRAAPKEAAGGPPAKADRKA